MNKRLFIPWLLVLWLAPLNLTAQTVHIWQDTPVRADKVTLVPYLPQDGKSNHTAVIVCPGGSYCWHDYDTEGTLVAEWLQQNGIAAFVLNYRVQGIVPYIIHSRLLLRGHKHPDMLQDIQRSIQLVRENAQVYGVDPAKIGAMGFSAGGHLVMSAACYKNFNSLALAGVETKVSLEPNFVAPVYPVVTMNKPYAHKRSRRALLGEYKKRNHAMRDSLSLEKHVPADCPPVFLVNCADDPVVKYQNSELLDEALKARGVNHLYIQYKTGGHGFGASTVKGSAECRKWKDEFLKWIKTIE